MDKIKVKTNSGSSILLDGDALQTTLNASSDILLRIIKQYGKDSKQHLIAESLFEYLKAGYTYARTEYAFYKVCNEQRMILSTDSLLKILATSNNKAALQEQLDKLEWKEGKGRIL